MAGDIHCEVKINNWEKIWEKADKVRARIAEESEQQFLSQIPTYKLILEILHREAARLYCSENTNDVYVRTTKEAYELSCRPENELPIPEHWGKTLNIHQYKED